MSTSCFRAHRFRMLGSWLAFKGCSHVHPARPTGTAGDIRWGGPPHFAPKDGTPKRTQRPTQTRNLSHESCPSSGTHTCLDIRHVWKGPRASLFLSWERPSFMVQRVSHHAGRVLNDHPAPNFSTKKQLGAFNSLTPFMSSLSVSLSLSILFFY